MVAMFPAALSARKLARDMVTKSMSGLEARVSSREVDKPGIQDEVSSNPSRQGGVFLLLSQSEKLA